MSWSQRSGDVLPQSNAISRAVHARHAQALPLIDLTQSNPTTAGLHYPSALWSPVPAAAHYDPQALGMPATRAQIAEHMRRLGVPAHAERLWLTASSSESYAYLFKLLCDAGDQVLVPTPSYPLFEHLARLECVDAVPYPLLLSDHCRIDMQALRAAITPRTRAIVIVSPNNPTGSRIHRDQLHGLSTLGLPIISDEVFGAYVLDAHAESAHTALDTPGALVFSLFGLSKLVGLPQLKLGWVCVSGPDAQVHAALSRLELIADTFLSVSTPVQLQANALLTLAADVRSQIQRRTRDNLRTLLALTAHTPAITVQPPEAGWCVSVRVPATRSEEAWVLSLIDAGVLVHPGHFYDYPREAYLVLSLLPAPDQFTQGVSVLCKHIASAL